MISSINSSMVMQAPPPRRSEQKISEEQQTLISDTLAELDPDNLTEADALSIVEAFSEAGIQPGAELEAVMSELGFDPKVVGELANIEGGGNRPPPPPTQSAEQITSMVSYLEELLEEQLASNSGAQLSEENKSAIYAKMMEKFGFEEGDTIINTTV